MVINLSRFIHRSNSVPILLGIILFLFGLGFAQENYKDKHQPSLRNSSSLKNTRGYSRFSKNSSTMQDGHSKYLRFTSQDGNLVSGGITNAGDISYSGVGNTPYIGWPKGAEWVSYIWGSYFYVAAEVEDVHGDTIHISSDYFQYGEQSPDGTHYFATMPLPRYFNLDQPDAQETPLVYGISEDVGIDGIPNSGDEGEGDGKLQPGEDFNGNGELDVSMQNVIGWFATSHRRETWPEYWPPQTYPGDDRDSTEYRPGKRAGRWNGEFGAYIRADQESYYAMDDRENDEFDYHPFNDTRPWPNGRQGLGLKTEVRSYQWNARLSEDILISIYDITNEGKDLPKCIVGMNVDPDLGGQYYNDDASFNQLDDITYAWNKLFTTNTGLDIGYFGFAFLESPGLAHDGVDNDEDGMTDESQNNGIDDDGDWTAWEDVNGNGVYDNEDLNYNGILDLGEDVNNNGRLDYEPLHDDLGADGLGPAYFEYTGPDEGEANGRPDPGEPNFEFTDNDESDQVGLTSFYLKDTDNQMANDELFWRTEIQPGTFEVRQGYTRDITFTYGSGFVEFAGDEKKHRYAIALLFGNDFDDILRNKRTMQVIYDNDYSFAKPPRQPVLKAVGDDKKVYLSWDKGAERSSDPIYGQDFEAYYIYKSTEPQFNDIKTITDAYGNPLLFKPLAIFDLNDGLAGPHPVRIGSELGTGSDLGVTYNMGTDSGLQHHFVDTDVTNGRTYYYAVASVDQGYHPDFYPDISPLRDLQPISPTECPVNIQTDPLGRPISFDPNTAAVIPTERSAGWVNPSVSDAGMEHVAGKGTGSVDVQVYNPFLIKTGGRYRIEFSDDGSFEQYDPDAYSGHLNGIIIKSVTEGENLISIADPQNDDLDEKYIIDGFRVILHNDTNGIDSTATGWTTGDSPLRMINFTPANKRIGRDYEIRILSQNADTSINRVPSNFQVWDVTYPDSAFRQTFYYRDRSQVGVLDSGDVVRIYANYLPPRSLYELEFRWPGGIAEAQKVAPENGDIFLIKSRKNYDRHDAIEFTMVGNSLDNVKAKGDLDNIYTVPDPYIAYNPIERKVINEDEGRGDRRIDFVNLPAKCTITIFTAAGKMVRILTHSATEENRRESWDLRTKDGLEIAHGIYFYVVEAPGIGTKTGKFAVIK